MLEYETARIELVQMIPPLGDTLACFEEDARRFLFPEPKLVPSFSGVDQQVLMTRAPHFPGIAPMLEFSTKTTITECSADAEVNIYPNVPMRPTTRRNRKCSSRPRTPSPQKKQPQTLGRRRGGRMDMDRRSTARSLSKIPRSQSLSPQRAVNTQRLERLSMDYADRDTTSTTQPMLVSWPGASQSALFTTSPLTRSSSTVKFSPAGRTKSLSNGLDTEIFEADSSSSETNDSLDYHQGLEPSGLWGSYREQTRHSSSHREWEEVHERVRGLLTTPKAVCRLVYGATASEVDQVLARRSISPGPP
ncbi:spermatogenesis associated 6-like protein [Channa argus]|uniref:spermatogenesis associated 6-like protein n=1 Tax=Channa argus TaxID=215402 RepID=UPI003521200B